MNDALQWSSELDEELGQRADQSEKIASLKSALLKANAASNCAQKDTDERWPWSNRLCPIRQASSNSS